MKLSIRMRAAQLKDLPAIYKLSDTPELTPPNQTHSERWWIRDHLKAKQILLVAETQSRLIGFIMGEVATGQVAILHLISVHPDWQRKGVGTKLLKSFENQARKRRCNCILGYVYTKSKGAKKLMTNGRYSFGSPVQEVQKFL